MRSYTLKERDYDVIVYGAGPEGVAAALAASERSDSVLLADECADVGGAAVCGLMSWWRGEAESALMEHVRKLTRRAWGKSIFEPEEISQEFRALLKKAGVDLMLGARPVKARLKRERLKSLAFAVGGKRVKLTAWCFVDASQDYALASLADCPLDNEEGETLIALLARIGGIDTRVPGVFDPEALRQFAGEFKTEQAVEEIPGQLPYPSLTPCTRGGTAVLNAAGPGVAMGAGPLARTAAESRCREDALAAIGFLQRNVPGYENCFLIQFAGQPLYIQCPQPLRRKAESASPETEESDVESIAVLACRDADAMDGSVSVPLGNLLCFGVENLLLARMRSAGPDELPLLMASGEAAGRAAAQAVLYDGYLSKAEPERMRRALIV
jgi:hypothetical protein